LNIPEGVSVQEACALASFLSLKIERENNLEEGDPRGIKLVVENLKKFGFTPNEESKSGHYHLTYEYSLAKKYNLDEECPELDSCLDLFVVDGDFKMFKKTNLSDRYEEWFTPVIEPKKVSKKR